MIKILIILLFILTVHAGDLLIHDYHIKDMYIFDDWTNIVNKTPYDVGIYFFNEDFYISWITMHLMVDTKIQGNINFVIDLKSKRIIYSVRTGNKSNFNCRRNLVNIIINNEGYMINSFNKLLYELDMLILFPCDKNLQIA